MSSILLEENIRRLSESIDRLVEQQRKAECVNYTTEEAGEALGYGKRRAEVMLKHHRDNGDIKLWRGEGKILYDKAEILELRKKLFSQHTNKSLNKAA